VSSSNRNSSGEQLAPAAATEIWKSKHSPSIKYQKKSIDEFRIFMMTAEVKLHKFRIHYRFNVCLMKNIYKCNITQIFTPSLKRGK
jgi:hypothetical protein